MMKTQKDRFFYFIVTIALILAFIVVVLGAYTRLTESGLGCPDWPGCYGHWVLPESKTGLSKAQAVFPDLPLEKAKALREMIHRYAAGTLAFLIVVLFVLSLRKIIRKENGSFLALSTLLLLLVTFQAALGMWTVTWKLHPLVVMGHLLGGLTVFALLRYWQLKLHFEKTVFLNRSYYGKTGEIWAVLGLLFVFIQIALGGWTSANYASLACIGFPACNGHYWPPMNFYEGFNLFSPIGIDYQGGNLNSAARIAIQMAHRFGAFIVGSYISILAVVTLVKGKNLSIRKTALLALFFVIVQFTLGIINVTHLLPLSSAVAHNAVAALLLAVMISWVFYCRTLRH